MDAREVRIQCSLMSVDFGGIMAPDNFDSIYGLIRKVNFGFISGSTYIYIY